GQIQKKITESAEWCTAETGIAVFGKGGRLYERKQHSVEGATHQRAPEGKGIFFFFQRTDDRKIRRKPVGSAGKKQGIEGNYNIGNNRENHGRPPKSILYRLYYVRTS